MCQPCFPLTLPEMQFIRLFTVMEVRKFSPAGSWFSSSIIETFILGVLILFYGDGLAPTLGFKFFEAMTVLSIFAFPSGSLWTNHNNSSLKKDVGTYPELPVP